MKGECILAVDVGSNTIKCLLGRAENGTVIALLENTLDRRILDRGGALVPGAAEIISGAVAAFRKEALKLTRDFKTIVAATSALRDSSEKSAIVEEVRRRTSLEISVLSGKDEAEISFAGAMSDPLLDREKSYAYFDLGGGSVEVVAGKNARVETSRSIAMGAVRLMRECASCGEYFARAKEAFAAGLGAFPATDALVGAGGAVAAARFMKAKMGLKGAAHVISLCDVQKCFEAVAPLSERERTEKFSISPGRADIIPAAFACIIELMRRLGKGELIHTFHNMRYGIVLEAERFARPGGGVLA